MKNSSKNIPTWGEYLDKVGGNVATYKALLTGTCIFLGLPMVYLWISVLIAEAMGNIGLAQQRLDVCFKVTAIIAIAISLLTYAFNRNKMRYQGALMEEPVEDTADEKEVEENKEA